jgi:hypothetical protein
MSRQPSGGGRADVAKGAGYAAFLGALLIGVAVIIGIVLLQIGDRNDNGPASTHPKTTTTKKPSSSSTTSTTKPSSHNTTPPKSPSQIHLIVLNGGAASGQAAHMESNLRLRGYTSQDTANTWTGHHQSGNTVYCKDGLQREGTALAAQVPGAKIVFGYPTPVPPFSSGTDCVVVVGS